MRRQEDKLFIYFYSLDATLFSTRSHAPTKPFASPLVSTDLPFFLGCLARELAPRRLSPLSPELPSSQWRDLARAMYAYYMLAVPSVVMYCVCAPRKSVLRTGISAAQRWCRDHSAHAGGGTIAHTFCRTRPVPREEKEEGRGILGAVTCWRRLQVRGGRWGRTVTR